MGGGLDGLFGIVGTLVDGCLTQAAGRCVVVWEGPGAEDFIQRLALARGSSGGEVWIIHVCSQASGWGGGAGQQRRGCIRWMKVLRGAGWEPSQLAFFADLYVVVRDAQADEAVSPDSRVCVLGENAPDYPVSKIGSIMASGGILIGFGCGEEWMRAAGRAGFVGEVGNCPDVWARRFVGRGGERQVNSPSRVAVIGAGLAGTSVAFGLGVRGVDVELFDVGGVASGASGNRAAVLAPMVSMDDGVPSQLSRFGCDSVGDEIANLGWQDEDGMLCGALQLAMNERLARVVRCGAERVQESGSCEVVGLDEARRLSGLEVSVGGLWFPRAGWLVPRRLCERRLEAIGRGGTVRREAVGGLERVNDGYLLRCPRGVELGRWDALVIATAEVPAWLGWRGAGVPTKRAWGRNLTIHSESLAGGRSVVMGDGYYIPLGNGRAHVGATYEFEEGVSEDDAAVAESLLRRVGKWVGVNDCSFGSGDVRRSMRVLTADRLPLIGRVVEEEPLYAVCGLGSRGMVWSGLASAILPGMLTGEPLGVPRRWVAAVDPRRRDGRKNIGGV